MVNGIQGVGFPLQGPEEVPGLSGAAGRIGQGEGVSVPTPEGAAPGEGASFSATIKNLLGGVNDLQHHSEDVFQAFVRGEVADLHQVALAQQEAGIALRLVTEMRDKLLMAYQEVMRTQM